MMNPERTESKPPTIRSNPPESQEDTDDVRQIEPDNEATISPTMNEDTDDNGAGEDPFDCFDTNTRLVDELERILQGDFAETEASESPGEDLGDADFPLAEPESEPELETSDGVAFDPGYPDDDWEDPEPPVTSLRDLPRNRFWDTDTDAPPPVRPRPEIEPTPSENRALGRFTIATIALMVVAGGTYAYVQLNGDPVVPLGSGAEIAAASPMGVGAPAFNPDVLAAEPTDEGPDPAPEDVEDFTPEPLALATETEPEPEGALDTTPPDASQPRLVQTVPVPLTPDPVATTEPVAEVPNNAVPVDNGLGGPLVEPETEPTPVPAENVPAAAEAPLPTETTVARPGTTLGTANNWVNLRDGPDNNTNVILTVPDGATLEVVACDPWCEVYYEGTRGWIWQDFVDLNP